MTIKNKENDRKIMEERQKIIIATLYNDFPELEVK